MEPRRPDGVRSQRCASRLACFEGVGADEPRLTGLLGLPAADRDPVTIITAAQLRLRRWRRVLNSAGRRRGRGGAGAVNNRIREISRARDALLLQACSSHGNRFSG